MGGGGGGGSTANSRKQECNMREASINKTQAVQCYDLLEMSRRGEYHKVPKTEPNLMSSPTGDCAFPTGDSAF